MHRGPIASASGGGSPEWRAQEEEKENAWGWQGQWGPDIDTQYVSQISPWCGLLAFWSIWHPNVPWNSLLGRQSPMRTGMNRSREPRIKQILCLLWVLSEPTRGSRTHEIPSLLILGVKPGSQFADVLHTVYEMLFKSLSQSSSNIFKMSLLEWWEGNFNVVDEADRKQTLPEVLSSLCCHCFFEHLIGPPPKVDKNKERPMKAELFFIFWFCNFPILHLMLGHHKPSKRMFLEFLFGVWAMGTHMNIGTWNLGPLAYFLTCELDYNCQWLSIT